MLSYESCKAIAESRANSFDTSVNRAYKLKGNFVFDNSDSECIGVLPIVISRINGKTEGLWSYINKHNLSMDDLKAIEF